MNSARRPLNVILSRSNSPQSPLSPTRQIAAPFATLASPAASTNRTGALSSPPTSPMTHQSFNRNSTAAAATSRPFVTLTSPTVHSPPAHIVTLLQDLCFSENRASLPEAKLVAKLQVSYGRLGSAQKHATLVYMATDLGRGASGVSPEEAIRRYETVGEATGSQAAALTRLREDLTPRFEKLCAVVARENGLAFLLRLRSDLIELASAERAGISSGVGAPTETPNQASKQQRAEALKLLDGSLRNLLAQFFSVGFLELRRITYEGTGGGTLEKIARYETVHKVRGLSDLKARLGRSRRCYALFHSCVPDEPLVFVHVALLPRVADSMAYIHDHSGYPMPLPSAAAAAAAAGSSGGTPSSSGQLGESSSRDDDGGGGDESLGASDDESLVVECDEREQAARAAIFYSINSTQPGLKGVELGNFLIKRVAHRLRGELPSVETFCTLSPVPGFTRWLKRQAAAFEKSRVAAASSAPPYGQGGGDVFLDAGEAADLKALLERLAPPAASGGHSESSAHAGGGSGGLSVGGASALVVDLLNLQGPSESSGEGLGGGSSPSWWWRAEDGAVAAQAKPVVLRLAARYLALEKRGGGHGALDPVANFHCRNGASLFGVHWGGDPSYKGLSSSCGIMVNYLYDLGAIPLNSEAYAASGQVPCSSPQVRALLPELSEG